MRTIKIFWVAAVVSFLIAAGLMYFNLGMITFIFLVLVPPFIMAAVVDDNKVNKPDGEEISLFMAMALVYSVIFSPWGITSLLVIIILITYSTLRKPSPKLSIMAAWLMGLEIATLWMEYYTAHKYYMDNLGHDVSMVIFAIYAVVSDIHWAKKRN